MAKSHHARRNTTYTNPHGKVRTVFNMKNLNGIGANFAGEDIRIADRKRTDVQLAKKKHIKAIRQQGKENLASDMKQLHEDEYNIWHDDDAIKKAVDIIQSTKAVQMPGNHFDDTFRAASWLIEQLLNQAANDHDGAYELLLDEYARFA